MTVKLYTTDCPKCKVLETKLKQKGVKYETITDIDVMAKKGFLEAPMLEISKEDILNFSEAVKWINNL